MIRFLPIVALGAASFLFGCGQSQSQQPPAKPEAPSPFTKAGSSIDDVAAWLTSGLTFHQETGFTEEQRAHVVGRLPWLIGKDVVWLVKVESVSDAGISVPMSGTTVRGEKPSKFRCTAKVRDSTYKLKDAASIAAGDLVTLRGRISHAELGEGREVVIRLAGVTIGGKK